MKTTRWKSTTKWLGLTPFDVALNEQLATWQNLDRDPAGHRGTLLGCEHPSTITLGRRSTPEELLESYDERIPVFKIDRGGQATLHAPGQLVIYPVYSLRGTGLGVRDFVRLLLSTTLETLGELGVSTENRDDAGLYTKTGKICFVGLRIEKGITRHGLSLNVTNELESFRQIRACGVTSQAMDRLANYPVLTDLEPLFQMWARKWTHKIEN